MRLTMALVVMAIAAGGGAAAAPDPNLPGVVDPVPGVVQRLSRSQTEYNDLEAGSSLGPPSRPDGESRTLQSALRATRNPVVNC